MQSNSRHPSRMLARRARASRLHGDGRDGDIVGDFLQGQRDCKDGVAHESGKSKDYDSGFNYQYWIEQRNTAGTL